MSPSIVPGGVLDRSSARFSAAAEAWRAGRTAFWAAIQLLCERYIKERAQVARFGKLDIWQAQHPGETVPEVPDAEVGGYGFAWPVTLDQPMATMFAVYHDPDGIYAAVGSPGAPNKDEAPSPDFHPVALAPYMTVDEFHEQFGDLATQPSPFTGGSSLGGLPPDFARELSEPAGMPFFLALPAPVIPAEPAAAPTPGGATPAPEGAVTLPPAVAPIDLHLVVDGKAPGTVHTVGEPGIVETHHADLGGTTGPVQLMADDPLAGMPKGTKIINLHDNMVAASVPAVHHGGFYAIEHGAVALFERVKQWLHSHL